MKYRIGVDLGTNSLGWAAVQLIEKPNSPLKTGPMLDVGARIFSDSRNPKDGSSNAVKRRGPRSTRRNRDRKNARARSMLHALTEAKLFPESKDERKQLERLDPWCLRARALDEKLSPYEIGRALFHLQERRGFKSNRKTDKSEDGAMFAAIKAARKKMSSSGARTLGELFGRPRLDRITVNASMVKGKRSAMPQARVLARAEGSKMAYDYYPDRAMILDEFEKIWLAQALHYPEIMTRSVRDNIFKVIEFQRPLKEQPVGKCTFLENEPRASKALPSANYFRVLQEVNNLNVGPVGEMARQLSDEERKSLIEFLIIPTSKTARRTFKSIRSHLSIPESHKFNLESPKRDHLVGDLTAATMMQDNSYGKPWLELEKSIQNEVIQKLLAAEQLDDFVPWVMERLEITEEHAIAVFDTRLSDGHGNLSEQAIDRLIPRMERGERYDEAAKIEFGDHRAAADGVVYEDELPYYGEVLSRHTAFEKRDAAPGHKLTAEEKFGRVANPTVHVALNELRKVMNDLIKRWGPPTEIVLELARDLPLSAKGKNELEREQKKNQDTNEERRSKLEKDGHADTYENRLKLRLFEEAEVCFGGAVICVFSGDTISKTSLFTADVQIEHILPISRTLDDSISNKVLATRKSNAIKKNRSPYEAFGSSPEGFDWEMISQRAANLPKSKNWRFVPNAMQQWEERGGDFLARQLNDTRYISKLGKKFLESIYGGQGALGQARQVWVVPGRLTADLRHHAGFNTLVGLTGGNRKDRTDHRHHAVDALVVALTDQAMIQRSANLAKNDDPVEHSEMMKAMAEPLKRYRASTEDRLSKLTISHKPDHGYQDAMHNDTAYGITNLKDEKKQTYLVTRKALEGMDKTGDLESIVDDKVRTQLLEATQGLKGKDFQTALVAEGKAMTPPVRRVRIHTPMKNTSFVTIHHGNSKEHKKAYKGDGNYCYDIFLNDKGKWDGEVITTFQAYQKAQSDVNWWRNNQRDDGTELIMRIRKGDMLEIDGYDNNRRRVIVYKFSKGVICMADHFEANASGRVRSKELEAIHKSPSALEKINARLITVSPSGKVRRQ